MTPPFDSPTRSPHRALTADRRHAGPGGSYAASAQSPVDSMVTLEAQIVGVLAGVSGRVGAAGDRSDLIRLRCKRLARMYRELAAAGEQLDDFKQIGERHAMVLLRRWRDRNRSAATIRSDWSILRVWCEALGKPGCVKTLREYWPDAPRAKTGRETASAPRHSDSKLLDALAQDTDRTHYFVERLCLALRFSVQEALLFPICEPTRATTDSAAARKLQAAMGAAQVDVQALLHEAAAFLGSQQRSALIWPGLELAQAMRRHENRLAYLRRKRADAGEEI